MKYLASKRRIVKEILPIILQDKDRCVGYYEPFCGGLSVIEKVEGIKKYASDINPFLIAMWRGLQIGLDKPMEIPKSLYDDYRTKYNKWKKDPFIHDIPFTNGPVSITTLVNALFDYAAVGADEAEPCKYDRKLLKLRDEMFLIGWIGFMGSYNGRFYDGGYSGKTDTRDYVNEQIRNTLKQVDGLNDIKFYCHSFKDVVKQLRMSAFAYEMREEEVPKYIIYCDPPYANTKQYDVSKNFNYDEFYDLCREVAKIGHRIYISEYNMPDDFKCIWSKEITNSLNTTKTYKPVEKLFTI